MSDTRPLEFANASNAGSIRISGSIEAAPIKDLPQGKIGDYGEENGNYYIIMGYILGLYEDNGKENGNPDYSSRTRLGKLGLPLHCWIGSSQH